MDVFSHVFPNESKRPIAFASRTLNQAEKIYSKIDKEALALYWRVFLFVCLFVCVEISFFHSYGDVAINGDGLHIFSYALHSWPLSSEGSLTRHIYCHTGLSFMVISEDPWHSHLLPNVWQWSCLYLFLRLMFVATGDRTPISNTRSERSTSTPPRRCYWGVRKFNTYLYGHKFTLVTDHKPLLNIFSPKKSLAVMTVARLERYAVLLSGYQSDIEFRGTKAHGNADAFINHRKMTYLWLVSRFAEKLIVTQF